MKRCSKCKEEKDESIFTKDKSRKDGLTIHCKECIKKYYLINKENKKRYSKEYYNNNSYKIKEKNKEYKEINKEYINIYLKEYRQTIKGRFYSIKGSAKTRNIKFDLILKDYEKHFYNNSCIYCGDFTSGVDRVDSSLGYFLENCVSCCTQCNIMKNDYSQEEFLNKIKKSSKI